jgi:glycosyltransferase involved in cell wall biosynthesis
MRIAFLVERPTQFEAPFFRHAAGDARHGLTVYFTQAAREAQVFDPELGRSVDWGFDLLAGYEHRFLPAESAGDWLETQLARGGFDLVIINGYTRRPYLEGLRAARRAQVPTGLRIDSVAFADRGGLKKRLVFGLFLRPAFDLFFATGSLTRSYLRSYGVPAERIALFPYAVDVASFARGAEGSAEERLARRRAWGLPEIGPLVLAVAKLNAREAPWDLVRATTKLGERAPFLVIAGDGPERAALEAFVAEHGLGRARFLGYVPYAELPALYSACNLFVHAAQEERWGVSVQEAMACGLPVVTSSHVGAGHDLVARGRNGFVYELGNPGELGKRLLQALELPPARVRAANAEILAAWDYAATWRGILRAAESLAP